MGLLLVSFGVVVSCFVFAAFFVLLFGWVWLSFLFWVVLLLLLLFFVFVVVVAAAAFLVLLEDLFWRHFTKCLCLAL